MNVSVLPLEEEVIMAQQPIVSARELMQAADGVVVLAFTRYILDKAREYPGSSGEKRLEDLKYPTVWNQLEAAMAFGLKLPLLVIVESGLHQEAMLKDRLEYRALSTKLDPEFFSSDEFKGIFSDWKRLAEERSLEKKLSVISHGMPKIFISHRHNDVAVVKALVGVLETAFDIQPTDLRCTSVPPYKLRVGDRTSDRLRAEIQYAGAVLGIVSPDVKESSYVLFELGASWGKGGKTFPLLVRGATVADIPSPISDLHTLSLNEESECYQLIDDLADIVDLTRRDRQSSRVEEKIRFLIAEAR